MLLNDARTKILIICLVVLFFSSCNSQNRASLNVGDPDLPDNEAEENPPSEESEGVIHSCPEGEKVGDPCSEVSDCAAEEFCGPTPTDFHYECSFSGLCRTVEDTNPSDNDFDDSENVCDESRLCTEDVNLCKYDELQRSCRQVQCVDGCLQTVRQTATGQVGYCEGGEGEQGTCVVCDSYQNGLYYGCKNPHDDKVDAVTPYDKEGFVSYEGPRGELNPEDSWSNLLKPGERRLSSFGMADGLEPHDMHGELVTWCYGQLGFLYVYNISTNWVQEIRIEALPHLCWWVSTDGEKIYADTSRPDTSLETDIVEIDLKTGIWRILDEHTQEATSLNQIFARNGRVVWSHYTVTKESQIASLTLQTNEFKVITDRPYAQHSPRLFNDTLVWVEHSGTGKSGILSYDYISNQLSVIDGTVEVDYINRSAPMAFEDHIVWFTSDPILYHQEKQYEIYMHTLSTQQTEMIPTIGIVSDPYGDDDLLTWFESTEEHYNSIRLMKLDTGDQFWLDDPAWTGRRSDPLIAGRWLVYLEAGRFPKLEGFPLGYDVILYDLCEHEEVQGMARCDQ